jgi:hypothetical protein
MTKYANRARSEAESGFGGDHPLVEDAGDADAVGTRVVKDDVLADFESPQPWSNSFA